MDLSPDLRARIDSLVRTDRVVLFMKGLRFSPACGFSSRTAEILGKHLATFSAVDVLSDPELRDGLKVYSEWPTFPQLYVDGALVGGADIVAQLDESGELPGVLGVTPESGPQVPTVTVTEAAGAVFAEVLADAREGEGLLLSVLPDFRHDLALETVTDEMVAVDAGALTLHVHKADASRLDGTVIDYVTEPRQGFRIENPNGPPRVVPLSVRELKARLAGDEPGLLIDVRTDEERELARIEGSSLLDGELMRRLQALPRHTPLVFYCHHGVRSQQAASHFLEHGFHRVYNVTGGIEAWSREVDPSVPRY